MTIQITCARCRAALQTATHICADQPAELEQIVREEIKRWLDSDLYPLLHTVPQMITSRVLAAGYRKTTP